jgi:hypothetical protein
MGARLAVSPEGRPSRPHIDALRAVAVGTGYHEIAGLIHVSRRTVARLIDDLKRYAGTSGLPELVAEAALRGWLHETAPTADGVLVPPRPLQLPPDPAGFVGREAHLAFLDGLIRPSNTRSPAQRSRRSGGWRGWARARWPCTGLIESPTVSPRASCI